MKYIQLMQSETVKINSVYRSHTRELLADIVADYL